MGREKIAARKCLDVSPRQIRSTGWRFRMMISRISVGMWVIGDGDGDVDSDTAVCGHSADAGTSAVEKLRSIR